MESSPDFPFEDSPSWNRPSTGNGPDPDLLQQGRVPSEDFAERMALTRGRQYP